MSSINSVRFIDLVEDVNAYNLKRKKKILKNLEKFLSFLQYYVLLLIYSSCLDFMLPTLPI